MSQPDGYLRIYDIFDKSKGLYPILLADLDTLREALAKTSDIHSTFQWEHFLEDGIDAHFLARTVLLDGSEVTAKASEFWVQNTPYPSEDYGLTLPKDKRSVAIYSRRAFIYPELYVYAKLPSLSLVGNETQQTLYLGLEHGSGAYNGIACFRLDTTTSVTNKLYASIGPLNGVYTLNIDVAKPSDFNTAYHSYRVILSKNLVILSIDSRIRAVAIQCLEGGTKAVKENVLPYSILLIPQMASALPAFVEFYAAGRTQQAPSDITIPLTPYRFRVADGKEITPLSLPLYIDSSDTKLAGYSISSGSVSSHPIPTWGYPNKTIVFMANQAGTLDIEVYTLTYNWRTYDSVSVPANTLVKYVMSGNPVLARVTFTPSTYPATINEAEVYLF
jgi:hypothetical protein